MTPGERVVLACFLVTLGALVCFWSVLTHGEEIVSIRLSGRIVTRGEVLRVTCKVPRDERNRALEIGIADETSSRRDLEGASAPVTTMIELRPNGCGEQVAYCAVWRTGSNEPVAVARLGFQATGLFCD